MKHWAPLLGLAILTITPAPAALVHYELTLTSNAPYTAFGGGSAGDIFTGTFGFDEALLGETIDMAVHSAKDVPDTPREGLDWCWLPWREDRRDALVLAPGRSLGAAEAAWLLRVGGRRADITIVETQGLPYWFEASGGTLNLSAAASVSAAALPANRQDIVQALSRFLLQVTVRPLYAVIAVHNSASLRVLEKSGFVIVGQGRGSAGAPGGAEVDEFTLKLDESQ